MNPYFKVDITSAEEEQQQVAKFLKILNSLGEHASSFLFQKGVVLGDDSFNSYDQQLNNSKTRDSITNTLLRASNNDADKDTQCLVAVLLFNMSKEATQLFSDVKARPDKIGASSAIIALGHLMALIDRATAFLNLPSVNDKGYWRLVTMQPPASPKTPPAPVVQKPQPTQPSGVESEPELMKAVPPSAMPQFRSSAPKPVMPPPKPPAEPPIPILTPKEPPKQSSKAFLKEPPELKTKAFSQPSKSANRVTAPPKDTDTKSAAKSKQSSPPIEAQTAADKNKPEGPIKAMIRRIADEIQDNSYEAILEAIKDKTLMADLYNTANNPITVKITEVNTKERTVYLIKQKRGAPEPVTFRLIRKLVTELQN